VTGRRTEEKALDAFATRAMTKTKKSESDKVPIHHSCHMP
jgi:hypothetical protein